jgi:protein ImuB
MLICEHMFVFPMVVCVFVPRFALIVAAGGRYRLLKEPAVLAPEPGLRQRVGEVSAAAEAYGIHAGMRLPEALARCPGLMLLPPDPLAVADAWERGLQRIESIGAHVEDGGSGVAYFDVDGLLRMYGGGLEAVVRRARDALGSPRVRYGAAPARFTALVATISRARARRAAVVHDPRTLWPLPVRLLLRRVEVEHLVTPLERLGFCTLGDVAALSRAKLAERFGHAGLLTHELVHGRDTPLTPRTPGEVLEESLTLHEAGSGVQLEHSLGLLIDRLLARRERRGRTLRAVVLAATLVEGGTWRERIVFRQPLSDAARIRMAISLRLPLLPAPIEALRLTVAAFAPPSPAAESLFEQPTALRHRRLAEAVRQLRTVAGTEAALRAVVVDRDSRVPERRVLLAPFEISDESGC